MLFLKKPQKLFALAGLLGNKYIPVFRFQQLRAFGYSHHVRHKTVNTTSETVKTKDSLHEDFLESLQHVSFEEIIALIQKKNLKMPTPFIEQLLDNET
jgi:hypothetical protein